MRLRTLLAAGATILALSSPAIARDLSVVTRGGPFEAAVRQAYLAPFSQSTGIAIQAETWDGTLDSLSLQAGVHDLLDVVLMGPTALSTACSRGLLQKLDWAALGGKDHTLPQGVTDCGLGAYVDSTVLTWDKDKLSGTPTWSDFWDVAKYPGRRGLREGARGTLEIALLADGVAPADVYSTLRTADGLDRAFRKLDQLKPYIVWWKTDQQAVDLLKSGGVLMGSAPADRVVQARAPNHGYSIQWNGSLYGVHFWAIPTGSPNTDAAKRFLAYVADPAHQAALAQVLPVGGLARGLADKVPPTQKPDLATTQGSLGSALEIDAAFWRDNGDSLHQRFEAWRAR